MLGGRAALDQTWAEPSPGTSEDYGYEGFHKCQQADPESTLETTVWHDQWGFIPEFKGGSMAKSQ